MFDVSKRDLLKDKSLRVGSLIALSSCRVLLIYNFTVSLGQKLITYRCPRMGTVSSLSIKEMEMKS